jgi:PIN domain nuclease of toxin-antitoxin system
MTTVLDSSALLALILAENGAAVVEDHLNGAIISTVNLAEVATKLCDRGATVEAVREEVEAAGVEVVEFDESQAYEAGRMRPVTREYGLSLGDRACLALALARQAPVLTTDQEWVVAKLPIDIRLIR